MKRVTADELEKKIRTAVSHIDYEAIMRLALESYDDIQKEEKKAKLKSAKAQTEMEKLKAILGRAKKVRDSL